MAVQAYPDLMEPWELTIVPVRGLPFGNGLILHGGEKRPELALALGFRPSEIGYVFDSGRSDADFSFSIARVGVAAATLLPRAAFAFVDPMALAQDAPGTGGDVLADNARRHRFEVRSTLAQAPPAPPSAVRRSDDGEVCAPDELVALVARAMTASSLMPCVIKGLPHSVEARPGIHAYALRAGDGIRLGVFARRSHRREPLGLTLRTTPDVDGEPLYLIAGRGAVDVAYDAPPAEHLLRTALSRMAAELYAATIGMGARYVCQYGAFHDQAFPGWSDPVTQVPRIRDEEAAVPRR